MSTPILILLVLTSIGLFFGFLLAYSNKKFGIEINPLIHLVEDILPKGQCGACGYAGCMAYAEAVVTNPDVAPNLCVPGKDAVAKLVADLTGKAAAPMEPQIAQVKCAGTSAKVSNSYKYNGVQGCIAANLLFGGPKDCKYGCLGLGTCLRSCPFGAITMSEDGLPIIDPNKCTACGVCVSICPKQVISLVPIGAKVRVNCSSKDKGAVAKKACSSACIGCGLCMRQCLHGAIKMENNLAIVDAKICEQLCTDALCLTKCPTKAIRPFVTGIVPGTETEKSVVAACASCAK